MNTLNDHLLRHYRQRCNHLSKIFSFLYKPLVSLRFSLIEMNRMADDCLSSETLDSALFRQLLRHYWEKPCENHVKLMWKPCEFFLKFHRDFTWTSHGFSHIISQKCEIPCEIIMWKPCETGFAFSLGVSQYCMWNTMWKICKMGCKRYCRLTYL